MTTATLIDKNVTDKSGIDKKAIMRDKRAQGIAAMGLVTRQGDRYQVQTPSLRGKRAAYEVWRDDAGRVRCSCLEFEEGAAQDASFRCEHILAVKHSLAPRPSADAAPASVMPDVTAAVMPTTLPASEPATQPAAQITAAPVDTNESASEESALDETAAADFAREPVQAAEAASFDEDEEADDTPRFAPRRLAPHTSDEEHTMKHSVSTLTAPATTLVPVESDDNAPLQFSTTLRALRQPVDPKLVKTREGWTGRDGSKHMVEYVEWHTIADILDRTCPAWSHSVKSITQINDMVAVTAAITIDGVTREGVGTGTADNETGIKKAEHDALKRAAIKFGLARELYQRESEVIERTGASTSETNGEFPRDPLAKSMADLVTPKQLGMIRALAREGGVDHEEECQAQLRCRTEELSKRAASSFIDHLKAIGAGAQQQQESTPMRRAS